MVIAAFTMSLDISEWDGALCLHEVDEKPACLLIVNYGKQRLERLGQVLTPSQVGCKPTIEWKGMDPTKLYTVVLTDPDVPSRDNCHLGEWHHYLLVNVKGNSLNDCCTLTEYVGSAPGKDTGLHRYTWLVYEQTTPLQCEEPILGTTSAEHRGQFKAADFRKKYKLGAPVAGACYLAEWDTSVPELYKQMGVE